MPQNSNNLPRDLRGAADLTIDAIVGITNIVESLHYTIAGSPKMPDRHERKQLQGIPGMVYRNVRTVTRLVGGGIDLILDQLGSLIGEQESPRSREAVLAIVNGVLGDYLAAKRNPLAIPMQLRRNGQTLGEKALGEMIQEANGRAAIMVHGLCLNDLHWKRRGHDHGEALARDLGLAPIYVHYNSGLHISENGRLLSKLLESLANQSPQPLELILIGYSMGGLVSRSACHYAKIAGDSWLSRLRKLVFLGTPHHGAFLERGGNWIQAVAGTNRYSASFARLGRIRSSGFTDLRYGNVVDEDWKGRDRFGMYSDGRVPVPLPEGVRCYAIAATTARRSSRLGDELIGDGLVPVSSALGHQKHGELSLAIPERQQWIGRQMNHFDLLNRSEVYETINRFLR